MKQSQITEIDRDNWKDNGKRFHRIKLKGEPWASLFDTSHDFSEGDEVKYELDRGEFANFESIEKKTQKQESNQPDALPLDDRTLRMLVPSSRKVAGRIAETSDEVKHLGDEILADYFQLISELQGKKPEEAVEFLRGERNA